MRKAVPYVIAVGCVLLSVWSGCESQRSKAATVAAIDSSLVWRQRAELSSDSRRQMRKQLDVLGFALTFARDSANRFRNEANELRKARRQIVPIATVLGQPPSPADTLHAVVAQLKNCELETDGLRAAAVQDSTALAKQELSISLLTNQVRGDSMVIVDGQRINANLVTQLRLASPPCRLGPFGCPSRTAAFVGGGVLGAVVVLALSIR